MGFEKTEDKDRSAVEGFETDVVDLDSGKLEDIKAVKAPRRSSRREPRFGARRDRIGRKETNTDDTPDNEGMVAPVRPVRLSGQGSGSPHIQKPIMKEGSDFAYLFTDQDEDQNDRHMDKAQASKLDGLAYDEQKDGDGDIYAELFASTHNGLSANRQSQPGSAGSKPVRNGFSERQEPPVAAPENNAPAGSGSGGADNNGPARTGRRSAFKRHQSSSQPPARAEDPAPQQRDGPGFGRSDGAPPYPGRDHPGDPRDHGRRPDRYDDGYDRMRGYDDRYGRDYPPYDYDRDRDYDRDYDRDEYRRRGYYRDGYEYDAEPPYGAYPYQMEYMGGYPPMYYPAPVPYIQAPVYGVPIQGIPYQGVPVQGMPVQGITVQGVPYPVPNGYNYVFSPVQNGEPAQNADGTAGQQPEQAARDAVEMVPKTADQAAEQPPQSQAEKQPDAAVSGDAGAFQETVVPERKPSAETGSGSSRFNRHGGAQARPAAANADAAPRAENTAREESAPYIAPVPGEDEIPHFRPHPHSQRSSAPEQPASSGQQPRTDAAGGAQGEAKPSDSRFRRRHSGES